MINNKKGRAVRTYLQETDQIQNKDYRDEIKEPITSFDKFVDKKLSRGASHCLAEASERYYQAQLLNMRAMQDEKFRIE
jgi:hypothetical protein